MIDCHAHWTPPSYLYALRRRCEAPRLTEAGIDCGRGLVYPLFDGMADQDAQRLTTHEVGVAYSLLALPPPGVDLFSPTEGVALARACNDELATLDGEDFGGVAVLPLQAPDEAAAELERAVGLGLRAAQLWSNAGGIALDPRHPVFDVAAAFDVLLLMHPTVPLSESGLTEYGLLTTLGFLYETTTSAMRLILGGLFERLPGLKLLVPHVGSVLPYVIGRIDYESALFHTAKHLSAPPSEYIRRLYTDSVCLWPPALRLALEVFGGDRVLFGTDFPFWDSRLAVATLSSLSDDERRAVTSANAQRLLGGTSSYATRHE